MLMRPIPKVFVLLSLYKPQRRFLRQQLETIENQDYENIEVLIWDDCPGEDFHEDIAKILKTRPFKYIRSEKNLGYVKAYEHLVKIAAGDYLAFCDQDDIWELHKLSRCVAELTKEKAILATSDRMVINELGEVLIPSFRQHSKDPKEHWKTGDNIQCQAVFTCYALGMTIVVEKKAVLQMLPFPENTGHDKWVTMCAAAMGRVIYIEEPLQRYRRHGANLSGTFNQLYSKADYYQRRVDTSCEVAQEFAEKFPDCPRKEYILNFAQARKKRAVGKLLKYRKIAPQLVYFESCLKFLPSWVFRTLLKFMQGR